MAEFIKKIATSQGEKQIDFQSLGNFPVAQAGQLLKIKTVDDNGKPIEWEAVSGSDLFNKEIEIEEVREKLGIARVNDIGNLHVWSRINAGSAATYILDEAKSYLVSSSYTGSTANKSIRFAYSDSVSVSDNGNASLVSPTEINLIGYENNISSYNVLKGKFCIATSLGVADTEILYMVYVPEDAIFTYDHVGGSHDTIYCSKMQRVIGVPASDISYPTSNVRTTYPGSGEENGCYYTYLGKLGKPSAKVEVGTYLGTGTASADILLGFTPKAVLVSRYAYLYGGGEYSGFILPELANETSDTKRAEIIDGGFRVYYASSTTVSRASYLNASGETYRYIAIG